MGKSAKTAGESSATTLSRRQMVQAGGIAAMGLGLTELLQAQAAKPIPPQAESCIFIVQYGGASHIDTLDPKPNAPEEIRGPYGAIPTAVAGLQVSSMLPRLARLSDQYAVVRSLTHTNTDHNGGMHICMTGQLTPKENTPCYGSVAVKLRPPTLNVPGYVWLQNLAGDVQTWYLKGGVLGASCAPLVIGKDEANPSQADFQVRDFDPPAGISPETLLAREQLLERLSPQAAAQGMSPAAAAFRQSQSRALELVSSPAARAAFDLKQEPEEIRDRYGRHVLGQNLLMARRLVEAGVRLVTVNAWCGRASTADVLATEGWDHHGAQIQKCGIFDSGTFSLGFVLPRFDEALAALLEDLAQRGLLDSTLVVVVGEFGRSPKIAKNPYPGREHWPQCYSALLAGAGVRGGAVYGSSDKHGAYVQDRPVSPADLSATVFHALGIAPETRFGPDGFSLRVSDGEPLLPLLS